LCRNGKKEEGPVEEINLERKREERKKRRRNPFDIGSRI
jgi:hypothetical protein